VRQSEEYRGALTAMTYLSQRQTDQLILAFQAGATLARTKEGQVVAALPDGRGLRLNTLEVQAFRELEQKEEREHE